MLNLDQTIFIPHEGHICEGRIMFECPFNKDHFYVRGIVGKWWNDGLSGQAIPRKLIFNTKKEAEEYALNPYNTIYINAFFTLVRLFKTREGQIEFLKEVGK